ncbi:VOC family protein [Pantoea sp. C2G6]|uniref:VOC family protein n=1 Tax=Pantoea sp. C2G6 TaxID=3243084 RepID=UPI003ED9EF10
MYSHVVVGAKDMNKSKGFYDAIFAYVELDDQGYDQLERPFYRQGKQRFIITKPINGEEATYANGGTIGFELPSAEAVHAWHKAGVENGGTSAESLPHTRPDGKCIAYLRDPVGNKLCAFAQTAV